MISQLRTRAVLLALFASAAFIGLVSAQESTQRRAPNMARLVVTHHGLFLQPGRVKAGPVKVLLDNRTLLNGTSISIGAEGTAGQSPLKRMVLPEKALLRKSWHDAVLSPGRYSIWVEKAPQVRTTLIVEP